MVFMTEWNGDIIEQHPPASHLIGEHALWNTFRLTSGHIDSTLPTAGGGEGGGGGTDIKMYRTITL